MSDPCAYTGGTCDHNCDLHCERATEASKQHQQASLQAIVDGANPKGIHDMRAREIGKIHAWTESLKKAAGILRAKGHEGDAATLEDIIRGLDRVPK